MKLKLIMNLLILNYFALSLVGCGEEDKLDYHMALSSKTCEITEGHTVAVNLTAHENLSFRIQDPNLVDVAYDWNLGEDKATIKITAKQAGETEIALTDNVSKETALIKVKVREYILPTLGAKKMKGNIFEGIQFYIQTSESGPVTTYDLSIACDSLVWTVNGVPGSFRVFDVCNGGNETKFTFGWEHVFVYPGEYKTYLTAWKDSKIIETSQQNITISNSNDFLEYNWSDISSKLDGWKVYADILESNPYFGTSYGLSGTTPYIAVRAFLAPTNNQALYDLMKILYPTPVSVFDKGNADVQKKYDELFSEQKQYSSESVEAIWVTEHANIAFLTVKFGSEDLSVVYAEPNKN